MAKDRQTLIYMGVPSSDDMKSFTAMKLLAAYIALEHAGYRVAWGNMNGAHSGWSQDDMSQIALDLGADYYWMIDCDMAFPGDVGLDLLRRNQDIVGCDYRTRKNPAHFTAKHFPGKGRDERGNPDPQGVYTSWRDKGMQEVDYVATGMLMVRRRVLEALPRPRFPITEDAQLNRVGNDVNFCRAARAAGFKVMCDFEASNRIGHLATVVLRRELGYNPVAASDFAEQGWN
jgi:hypothetical protein